MKPMIAAARVCGVIWLGVLATMFTFAALKAAESFETYVEIQEKWQRWHDQSVVDVYPRGKLSAEKIIERQNAK